LTKEAGIRAKKFYESFVKKVELVSSPEVAELSKLLENTYRFLNISFVNQFHDYCLKLGINSIEVIEAAATKSFGFQPFYPGAGIGGHCIPVDSAYLRSGADEVNFDFSLVRQCEVLNENRYRTKADLFVETLKSRDLFSSRVLLYGVTYKKGVPDTRESPAMAMIHLLRNRGLDVEWYDPLVDEFMNTPRSSLDSKFGSMLVLIDNPSDAFTRLLSEIDLVVDMSISLYKKGVIHI